MFLYLSITIIIIIIIIIIIVGSAGLGSVFLLHCISPPCVLSLTRALLSVARKASRYRQISS